MDGFTRIHEALIITGCIIDLYIWDLPDFQIKLEHNSSKTIIQTLLKLLC